MPPVKVPPTIGPGSVGVPPRIGPVGVPVPPNANSKPSNGSGADPLGRVTPGPREAPVGRVTPGPSVAPVGRGNRVPAPLAAPPPARIPAPTRKAVLIRSSLRMLAVLLSFSFSITQNPLASLSEGQTV